jgi:hypothetical protein
MESFSRPPIGLDGVVGHATARASLASMLRRGRTPNGILITGPAGVGRRTLAWAVSCTLLAGDADLRVRPRSASALKLARGSHADFEILDREEPRRILGVEAVRGFQAAFALRPLEGRGRVGVVVDADRLSPEAANALLKLLEEPPPGSHLILTARSRWALLPTILSRCQVVPLAPLSDDEVRTVLGPKKAVSGLELALAQGRPGLAHRLAGREDAAARVLAAARLLAPPAPLLATTALVLATVREAGKAAGEARERLREVLETALLLVQAVARETPRPGWARTLREAILEAVGPAVLALGPQARERRARAILGGLSDLEANLNLDSVVEGVLTGEFASAEDAA